MLIRTWRDAEMQSANYRLEAALWQLAFEMAYDDYVPLPEGCADYYEFFQLVRDWYEEDITRSCERCPLVLTKEGENPGFTDWYSECWDDWMVLQQAYDNEAITAKWWAKNNLQLLIEVYGNESAN